MIINIPFEYDKIKHQELCAQIVISEETAKEIVKKCLYSMDYYERQTWIAEHAEHKVSISEEECIQANNNI